MEVFLIFIAGMAVYPALEIVWRGYTHITMAFAGGICACAIYLISTHFSGMRIFLCALVCCAAITATELVFGLVFNIGANMNIWDYSQKPFNFLGQICLEYCALWYLICLAVIPVFRLIHGKIHA